MPLFVNYNAAFRKQLNLFTQTENRRNVTKISNTKIHSWRTCLSCCYVYIEWSTCDVIISERFEHFRSHGKSLSFDIFTYLSVGISRYLVKNSPFRQVVIESVTAHRNRHHKWLPSFATNYPMRNQWKQLDTRCDASIPPGVSSTNFAVDSPVDCVPFNRRSRVDDTIFIPLRHLHTCK